MGVGRDLRRAVRGQPLRHPRQGARQHRDGVRRGDLRRVVGALARAVHRHARRRRRRPDLVPVDHQLVAAAPAESDDARPGDGRLHDHPARHDAHRRTADRVDQRPVRTALGLRGRRHRHHPRCARCSAPRSCGPGGPRTTRRSTSPATSSSASTARRSPRQSVESGQSVRSAGSVVGDRRRAARPPRAPGSGSPNSAASV